MGPSSLAACAIRVSELPPSVEREKENGLPSDRRQGQCGSWELSSLRGEARFHEAPAPTMLLPLSSRLSEPVSSLHSVVCHRNLNRQDRGTSSQFSRHLETSLAMGPESKDQPLNRVEPPERTMFEKSVRRRSMSDFWMANTSTSWMPSLSSPIRSGLNSSSGARNREGPICRVGGQTQRWGPGLRYL